MQQAIEVTVQVLVLSLLFYYVLLFFVGTRGAQVLGGLVIVLIALIGLTQISGLDALNWLLRQASVFLGLGLLIVFQPEIRRALAELGSRPILAQYGEEYAPVEEIVQAVKILAESKVGALIAIEREASTRAVQGTGTRLDARATSELLASLFFPHTPLHDGGVIVRRNRIVAAGCVFPLSQNGEISKRLGTRHRAAVGLTEETDAIVIVVSEETGAISVSCRGRLSSGLDEQRLARFLNSMLRRSRRESGLAARLARAARRDHNGEDGPGTDRADASETQRL
ncbi:MAG: TIGR00159 family protein [Lentisphaerae bacterium]|nr:TIGR00159 family protein [Lentisphaerota bacterium]